MSREALRHELEQLEGRPYGQYRALRGRVYALGQLQLCFDHVQGDPFAAPSRISVELLPALGDWPVWACETRDARRAAADFLQRALRDRLSGERGGEGSGKSGLLEIAALGQEVLERSSVVVDEDGQARLRLQAGLPAAGRRILGRAAARMLCERLPRVIEATLSDLDLHALRRHVQVVEDQVALRAALEDAGLIAFVAQGSRLPRRSGADDRPLEASIPLEVEGVRAVELDAPHAGRLSGLGIPRGVSLVVGGGYHGKSTLLQALALGVYDHVPDDGRERCVSSFELVSVRSEDGRSVRAVDLEPFIHDLPLGRETRAFDSDDASGSTSQAAAIVEALEAGACGLLIDEDTAATNFMLRDARMRMLVPADKEPITPFIDRVRQLWEERGVSSVIVVGGAGDYLDVADLVLQMDAYRPRDVTRRAREVATALPLGVAAPRAPGPWPPAAPRVPLPEGLDPRRGRKPERVRSLRTRSIEFGREEIDVAALYQLIDPGQARMIGDALLMFARGLCDGGRSLAELLDALEARIGSEGLDAVTAPGFGDRARARRFEIAAALNRLRSLKIRRGAAQP